MYFPISWQKPLYGFAAAVEYFKIFQWCQLSAEQKFSKERFRGLLEIRENCKTIVVYSITVLWVCYKKYITGKTFLVTKVKLSVSFELKHSKCFFVLCIIPDELSLMLS